MPSGADGENNERDQNQPVVASCRSALYRASYTAVSKAWLNETASAS